MDEKPVLVERRDGYHVVTLNRPQRLNACNEAMLRALRAALSAAEGDTACRALMLTGAGRAFCTGQDLTEEHAHPGEVSALADFDGRLWSNRHPQPETVLAEHGRINLMPPFEKATQSSGKSSFRQTMNWSNSSAPPAQITDRLPLVSWSWYAGGDQ